MNIKPTCKTKKVRAKKGKISQMEQTLISTRTDVKNVIRSPRKGKKTQDKTRRLEIERKGVQS